MPEYLLHMLSTIPVEHLPGMTRSRAIVTGLSYTMSCGEVVHESWFNRLFNLLEQPENFIWKLKNDAMEICYEHMENICDFKGVDLIRARWTIGRRGLKIDRAS